MALVIVAIAVLAVRGIRSGPEPAVQLPPAAVDPVADGAAGPQTLVLAGGCFWGVQAVFQHTRGVLGAVSGYAGGPRESATYEQVSGGLSGHAEAVQITYDPRQVSLGQLLQIFFSVAHDPTQRDRQGPDFGRQYRSAIFYGDAHQQTVAQHYISQLDDAGVFGSRIATEVSALQGFYPAEAHHQDYATRFPDSPYIATFDRPKLRNLRQAFAGLYRETPVLVSASRPEAARSP
ncbi:MAG: peptide-methionine (S)-S-oxide reductase MsrA [Ramlibacter sp.]|nr:peptide-methionine (S)-S-oxide reductase MsrA [Ramlibacter sp.]